MNCIHCVKPLKDAQYSDDKGMKSCPRCSTNNGVEHIYYPIPQDFGITDKRITEKNPDGLQSYCSECRGGNEGPHSNGISCSQL